MMHNQLPLIIFYIFAGITLFSAFMVITQNNPVRCVLFLVLAFFTSAVLWILVEAEFLALILVLVYVGAVMTLFLFVVMMLNVEVEIAKRRLLKHLPLGLIALAMLLSLFWSVLPKNDYQTAIKGVVMQQPIHIDGLPVDQLEPEEPLSNTAALGMVLYTDYVFAFELAAVLLLVAIVAAITLVHRKPRSSKQQRIVRQIMTRREDRVRLIRMKSE